MDMFDKLYAAARSKEAAGVERVKNLNGAARKRFGTIISKKITTSFIGAIAKVEQHFGFLWGHGKPLENLTEREREWYELWQLVRTEILNNGNNQLRAVESEILQYTMTWNKYNTVFKTKQEDCDE